MSTAVEKPADQELVKISPEEQALIDDAKAQIDTKNLLLPAIKLTQSLTAEVAAGDAEAGHYINSVTGEDYGDSVEFVVSAIFKGRFYSDRQTNQSFAAQGDIAPDTWPEEYAGQHFDTLPDAEEQWAAAANANEHEWGSGPPISTTYNFVGYVVNDGVREELPARLSLMRSRTKTAKKLETLIASARAPWDHVFKLKAKSKVVNERPFFVDEVSAGGATPNDVRQGAINLAQEYKNARQAGEIELEGDEDSAASKRAKPSKGDGLDV